MSESFIPKKDMESILNSSNFIHKQAVEFLHASQLLWYENSVELVIFRNKVIQLKPGEILELVSYAEKFVQKPIKMSQLVDLVNELKSLSLPSSKIDIGKLTNEWLKQDCPPINEFVRKELYFIFSKKENDFTPKDVVLFGFGRIGRILTRELSYQFGKGKQLRLRAIVVRGELTPDVMEKRADNLRYDSIHGKFEGDIQCDYEKKHLIINGIPVQLISSSDPTTIDYTQYGIEKALVIDNTGAFRDYDALSKHLESNGVSKVLLTAPGKGIPNIVYGVNQKKHDIESTNIWSAASCTTNAIAPVLQILESEFGILNGHVETIHAYTNDQNLVDNFHKKYRRGRAAAMNMVITETGAGQAVSKAIPSLEGKLTSNAIRVPIPNGSLAILKLQLEKETNLEDFQETIRKNCLEGDLVEQIKFSINNELVSSDIIGASTPSVYDSNATKVSADGKNVVIYMWYDNEYGYCRQVMKLAKYVGDVIRPNYY